MSAPVAGSGQGMHNLTTLIKRLEAATSRLEDIASSSSVGHDQIPQDGVGEQLANATNSRSKSIPAPPGAVTGGGGLTPGGSHSVTPPAPAAAPLPPAISAMDELLDGEAKSFVEAAKGLDSVVESQATAVAKAFRDQRKFLLVSTKAKKPDMSSPSFSDLIKDLQQDMGSVGDIRDSNRASPMKEHLAMVGEGISALQWLVMDGKPADYINEVTGGAQMYGNRVLKAYKETDPNHVKYVQSYYVLLKALSAYVKKHYPSGVIWNNNGVDAAQAYREADSAPTSNGASSAPSGGAPPPPPPPPLPTFDNGPPPPPPPPGAAPTSKASGGDMNDVFQQLNQGENVTKGLKKVDKSQMTHKNPALRAQQNGSDDGVSRSRSRGPETKPKPASMRQNSTASTPTKRQGKTELDGNKWIIENHDSPTSPIQLEVSNTQSLLISGCKNTTIVLKGKANAISIDNCPRLQIVIESLISSIDVIKSPNFAVQINGALPTILLDQVDGATIYLGKESLHTEVFTSKCSSINVVLPPAGEEDDSRECPLPEQLRTYVKDGRLVSEIVEHAG